VSGSLLTDHIYAADPSAHVFKDRLYLYVSYDEPNTNSYDSMVCYHVVSTDDLVNWVDHGRVLHLDQVEWALSHMWAIDANYFNGKYYLTFCAIEKSTGTFKTGLAVSDRPEGPFTDIGFIDGVEWGQDPAFFIDEGNIPYLIWGGRGSILIAQLNEDLLSVKSETITNISEQINGYEGPFLHKYKGTYYLTYPALDGEEWPQRMSHATADNIFGPYKARGIYIDQYEGHSGTIHGSVVQFKGQWLAFYHSGWVSGTETSRSLMMDRIEYDDSGNIKKVTPSESLVGRAVAEGKNWKVQLRAASAVGNGGKLFNTRIDGDFVTGFISQESGLRVLFQNGKSQQYRLTITYRSKSDRTARVLAGTHLFYNGIQNQTYEQYINRGTNFPSTHGEWREIEIGVRHYNPGEYLIRLSNSHNDSPDDFEVAYVNLYPVK
jgi:Glycosyl hydrolases family 43